MASGSSGRANSGSKGFDFGSDDILCSYEDYSNQDTTNGGHNDAVMNSNSVKDFHKSRMGRSSMFPTPAYGQPEDSFNQEVISTVERSMKKYADNLMRFLEGISSRLSQLELYCYNLDKTIGEMRSDLVRDHGEADSKLKSLEKHLQEVHRSVQILRDKQELAETQKELAKLQLVQKESSSSSHSQSNEERTSPPISDSKKTENTTDTRNQQLALELPHQVAPPQQAVAPLPQAPSQNVSQQQSYYLPSTQLPNPPPPAQHPHNQYVPSESQYRATQLQDVTRVAPPPTQPQVNQAPSVQHFPQYQQQLPQQMPQQVPQQMPQQVPQQVPPQMPQQVPQQVPPQMPQQVPPQMPQQVPPQMPQQVQLPQQSSMQSQIRPPSSAIYSSYSQNQPPNPSSEGLPSSMPMQVPFSGINQQVTGRAEAMPYGYSGAGRTVPQQSPPQQMKGAYGAQPGDGYAASGPHPALPPGSTYMIYDTEGGRSHYQPQVPHFTQGGYTPMSVPLQNPQPASAPTMVRNPQFFRNHPYGELIEKLVNMGFRGDHVASVIQRMEDSGQHIDFNAVLDRLSMH